MLPDVLWASISPFALSRRMLAEWVLIRISPDTSLISVRPLLVSASTEPRIPESCGPPDPLRTETSPLTFRMRIAPEPLIALIAPSTLLISVRPDDGATPESRWYLIGSARPEKAASHTPKSTAMSQAKSDGGGWSAKMYTVFVGAQAPSHDGMRCALFLTAKCF